MSSPSVAAGSGRPAKPLSSSPSTADGPRAISLLSTHLPLFGSPRLRASTPAPAPPSMPSSLAGLDGVECLGSDYDDATSNGHGFSEDDAPLIAEPASFSLQGPSGGGPISVEQSKELQSVLQTALCLCNSHGCDGRPCCERFSATTRYAQPYVASGIDRGEFWECRAGQNCPKSCGIGQWRLGDDNQFLH